VGGPVFPTSRVDGHWHTRHLTEAELAGLLTSAGRGDVLARWESHTPPGRPRLTLSASVVLGHSLWLGTDDRPYGAPLDWGSMEPRGEDRVGLRHHHSSTPTATLRYTVAGSRLTFEVVRSAWPDRDGVSGRAQVGALYASLPFTRFVGSGPPAA
jgi:hypothetical protein